MLDLDEPAGPPGSTVRHLLAHASGLPFDGPRPISKPGKRRIYSNTGIEVLATFLDGEGGDALPRLPLGGRAGAARAERHRARRVRRRPGSRARSGPARIRPRAHGPDPCRARRHSRRPPRSPSPASMGSCPTSGATSRSTGASASRSAMRRSRTGPGTRNSPRTFGHFGGAGSFIWVDPEADAACAALADRQFGQWAKEAWPPLSDAVLAELR